MFVFPSAETATSLKSPPWLSLAWLIVTGVVFLTIGLPESFRYQETRTETVHQLEKALEAQLKAGDLKQGIYFQAVQRPAVIEEPSLHQVFNAQVKAAYSNVKILRSPLLDKAEGPPNKRLFLLVQPHHFLVMMLGFCLLIPTGFLFEHLFDSLWIATCFLVNGATLLVLDRVYDASWVPSPLFAWFWLTLLIMLVPCILKPRCNVTLTLRLWLGSTRDFEMKFPVWFFPITFIVTSALVTWYLSDFDMTQTPQALPLITAQALLNALVFMRIPTREHLENSQPEVFSNRQIAQAESLFEEQKSVEALAVLRGLLQEDIGNDQFMRVAHLAFRHDDHELSSLAYQAVLRSNLRNNKHHENVQLILEMLERNLRVPGGIIERALETAYTMGGQHVVVKILPHLHNHPDIEPETVHQHYSRHIDALLRQNAPDRNYLHELQRFTEYTFPNDPLSMRISQFLHATAPSIDPPSTTTPQYQIGKFIEVEIIRVKGNDITVELAGGKQQRLPWTAILALYGCHVLGGARGFRGYIMTRNRNKIFCCCFNSSSLSKYEGESGVFENVWKDILNEAPEDLPRVALSDFDNHLDEKGLEEKVQAFLNQVPV